jgi:hypothetical protein
LLFGSLLIKNYNFHKSILILVLFAFLLPAILVVVLRGNIGTDTLQYLRHFESLAVEGYIDSYEPGFNYFTAFINLFGFNDHFDVAIVGFLTIFLLVKSFSNSRESVFLFIFILFPIFFYELSMNTLRAGLAFALSAIAVDSLDRKKNLKFVVFALLSIFTQYSSFLIILFFLVFKLEKKYLIGLLVLVAIILTFGLSFFADNLSYLYNKQDAYKDIISPSGISGLAPLILFLLIFTSFVVYTFDTRSNALLILLLVFEVLSFLLAKISYAGLRFQLLFLFALILLIKQEQELITNKRPFFKIMLILGLIGFVLTMRNITAINDDFEASFVPYQFFWE